MTTASPREVFLALVHGVAEGRYEELPELYAERTNVRHPMSPAGGPPLTSRDDLRRHFAGSAERVRAVDFSPADVIVHETADPEVIVAEFAYAGTVRASGEPFRVPCVFVLRIRDGQVLESRDYADHLAFARARGELDQLFAALCPLGATAG